MTLDDLCDVFGQASGAEYDRWINDRPMRGTGPALLMRRAGLRAVVTALWDRMLVTGWDYDTCQRIINEILASEGVEYTGGMNDLNVTPAADVCEWTPRKNVGWFQPSCRQSRMHETSAVLNVCPSCGKPISFKEPTP